MDKKCFYNFLLAVVKQAVRDYKLALKKRDFYKIQECEEFFLSEYGQALTFNHGQEIVNHFRAKVAKRRYKNG